MKFFSQIFGGMEGADILGPLSLLIFLTVFVVALIRALRLKKKVVEEYERMPLDDNSVNTTND